MFRKYIGEPNEALAYDTQRISRVHDWRLGGLYYGFVVAVACYVVGFQIFYANEHFKRRDVRGTARVTIQQPTKFCNPNKPDCESNYHSLKDLPYCKLYDGAENHVDPKFRQKCVFADQHSLAPAGMLKGEMFIPTRIDTSVEHKGCTPSEANEYTCNNEFRAASTQEVVYVADVERYTLLITHSFHRGHLEGNSNRLKGSYLECVPVDRGTIGEFAAGLNEEGSCDGDWVKKEMECINDACRKMQEKGRLQKGSSAAFLQNSSALAATLVDDSEQHSEEWLPDGPRPGARGRDTQLLASDKAQEKKASTRPDVNKFNPPDVFAIADGDIFKLSKILELAGGLDLDRTFNTAGEPLRESGTVLEIEIIYQNLVPWGSSFGEEFVTYTYKFNRRPMEEMKTELYAQAQPADGSQRIMENRHGIYIITTISGEFGFFSIVYTIIMLTTAAGLMGAAVLLTDQVAIRLLPEKDLYYSYKYNTFKTAEETALEEQEKKEGGAASGQA